MERLQRPLQIVSAFVFTTSLVLAHPAFAFLELPDSLKPSPDSKIGLPWHAGYAGQNQKIRCFAEKGPTAEELLRSYEKASSGAKSSATIDGVEFTNESTRALAILRTLSLQPATLSADYPHRGIGESLRTAGIDRPTVSDALSSTFGKTEGLQIFHLLDRYRVNASHLHALDSAPWKENELNSLILSLSDLPPHLRTLPLPPERTRYGYHFAYHARRDLVPQSADGNGKIVVADSFMRFFQPWTDTDAFSRRTFAFHEFAHNVQSLIASDRAWNDLSPWPSTISYSVMYGSQSVEKTQRIHSNYSGDHKEPFVSEYAKKSPGEDFAESMTAYRYAPAWLKERHPGKYAYMKAVVFDGIEYLSEESCATKERLSTTILRTLVGKRDRIQSEIAANSAQDGLDRDLDAKERISLSTCNSAFLKEVPLSLPDSATSKHEQCLAEIYLNRLRKSAVALLGGPFLQDYENLRKADGTGEILPTLTPEIRREISRSYRERIRNGILSDWAAFIQSKKRNAKNCSAYSYDFLEWAKSSQNAKGALHSTGLLIDGSSREALQSVVRASCVLLNGRRLLSLVGPSALLTKESLPAVEQSLDLTLRFTSRK